MFVFWAVLLVPTLWGQAESGLASWYGDAFHGRRTASGEYFDQHDFTAAHKTLPFGTFVEVTDLATDRKVVVRINDRGPFVSGRILDLSRAAAESLRMTDRGVIRISLRVVSAPETATTEATEPEAGTPSVTLEPVPIGGPAVQVGSFSSRVRAESFAARFKTFNPPFASYVQPSGNLYRVLIAAPSEQVAAEILDKVKALGFPDAFVRL